MSDPRRAYAGHTLYKVTSKVFQSEFPEGATEIAVWRRFSDFKKLHQELLKIYTLKHFKDEEFPPFPKAKFFGRFEEGVIEERRKAALELLTFAGSIPDLFTSQPFVKFFEGGFPDSPVRSDSLASQEGSSSDAECESPRAAVSTQGDKNPDSGVQIERQSPSPSCSSSKENGDNLDEASLGGVWLYKQPSLTEGLDSLSSGEEDNDFQEPSHSTPPEPETEGEQSDLTRQSNKEIAPNAEEDHDDVFTDDIDECSENESEISEREERASSTKPPNWLVRAISICSEGEDLEALASEADTEELSFPQAFSEHGYCSSEERTDENESSKNVHEAKFPSYLQSDSWDDLHLIQNKTDASENLAQNSTTETPLSFDHKHISSWGIDLEKTVHSVNPPVKSEPSDSSSSTSVYSKDSRSLKDSISVGTAEDKQSFTSSSDSGKVVTRQRTISDLGNIFIDRKESDYLYVAGHTIHKALECEVNGRYEEAFSLYKTCVGGLLSGVQGEKDIKRREAVRRKTAQYLLKAEALYNTYLVGNESPEKTGQDSLPSHPGTSICESDDLHTFKDLTLADLKVIGIVGKVILVENVRNGETYVVKALCKSGPARAHGHSHGSEHRRKKSVRRLFGKYPNIVQLYRYFETASTVYLLLEYARGGRLWDHLACYQRDTESHVLGNTNKRNTQDLIETTHGQVETQTVSNNDTMNVNRLSAQCVAEPLKGKDTSFKSRTHNSPTNSTRLQCSQGSAKASNDSVLQPGLTANSDGITVQRNGNNNSSVNKMTKDLEDKCSEKEAEASRANKHLVFKKLDEYFASSVQYVPHEHVRIWAAELVLAVAYLHTAGIICRDLHPKNVLLDEEGHVLLTYFGSWEETEHIPDEDAMNHFYCAPEIWQVDEVTAAADWWSVGALLYELITGQALSSAHPWGIKTHTELQLPNKISPEARSLLKELLRVIPAERLGSGVNGVEEIKSHPFFSGVNWAWLCSRIN